MKRADFIFKNATVIDGSGTPGYFGGVAVRDDRIVEVGSLEGWRGANVHDLEGKAIAPGFFDVHTHDDRALLVDPEMTAKISQGVTSVVTGNCGVSIAPLTFQGRPPGPLDLVIPDGADAFADFGDYLTRLEEEPASVNALCQVGHSTLRLGVMDRLDRAATGDEIKEMAEALDKALEAGAVGFSTGLDYPPAKSAPTEEVIELAKVLKSHGALHTTHMRDEGVEQKAALEETFEIGRSAGVPVVISHHKCSGVASFGKSVETLAMIDKARAVQSVGLDAYPYTASSTMLSMEHLADAQRVLVTWSVPHPEVSGRDLGELAEEFGLTMEATIDKLSPAGAVYFAMDEADVRRILSYPHTMIGSDGLPHDLHPHPRLWGTFPRVLGHYARDQKLFTVEEAVRKMTSLPARQFGVEDRGMLRTGAYADLVVFDPASVIDRADFENPTEKAEGIDMVLVNGRVVWRDGHHTRARSGRALRRR